MTPSTASIQTQLRRGTLEYCVLGLLDASPQYGLQLADSLRASPALFTSEGTLYPLLTRLRAQGWVATQWHESPTGPPRRYYALTEAGKGALGMFRAVWQEFARQVDHILEGEK